MQPRIWGFVELHKAISLGESYMKGKFTTTVPMNLRSNSCITPE